MAIADFEGLTPGTTPTAAAAGFQFISAPAGGGAVVTDVNPFRGTRALTLTTGSSGALCMAERSGAAVGVSSNADLRHRVRLRAPVLPPDATGVRVLVVTDSTGSFRGEVRLTNGGKLQLRDAAGAILATSSATYAANQWIDVGLRVVAWSTTAGQLQMGVWNGANQLTETLTSSATLNTTGAGGANKLQVGAIRSGINLWSVVIDDYDHASGAWPALPASASVRTGPWAGAVTPSAFTAVWRLSGATSARLVASTSADLATSPVYSAPAAPDSYGLVKLTATGLAPFTEYHYGVEVDGTLLAAGRGVLRTFPTAGAPASYSVWFGSCLWTQPTAATFDAITAKGNAGPYGPALFGSFMGDMHYRDFSASVTLTEVLDQYVTVSLGSAAMAPLLARSPLSYLWDNHDGPGDVGDKTAGSWPVLAAAVRQVFPHYPFPASDGRGGYHSWVAGRVRWIQLDVRAYRDPQTAPNGPGKTMLGAEQLAWLQAELVQPEPVKIICGNYYWRQDSLSSGRWGSYADEFKTINDFVQANRAAVGGLFVIFGDRHALAADDGSSAGARGIPQAGGAPFQQGSTAPGETWSHGYYHQAPATIQCFGWLNITDTGDRISVEYEGVTSQDLQTRVQMTTVFEVQAAALPGVWGVQL